MRRSLVTGLPGALLLLAGLSLAFSFLVAEQGKAIAERDVRLRKVRATLVSTGVRKTSSSGGWTAYGDFDVATADGPARAHGTLDPEEHRRLRRHDRRATTREQALGFLERWRVGETYDAFQDPDYPRSVFFQRLDPGSYARPLLGLRALAALLAAAGAALAWRRRATRAPGAESRPRSASASTSSDRGRPRRG